MAEAFGFKENFSAGPPGRIDKHVPAPGEVVVEVYTDRDELVYIDRFNGVRPAPRNSIVVSKNMWENPWDNDNGVPGTFTALYDARGRAFLEWRCPVDMPLPFEIPQHITSQPGAAYMRCWWGSKEPD